jgi:fructan beta-fructosidase
LEVDLSKTSTKEFGIELSNSKGQTYRIIYNVELKKFTSDRTNSGKKDFSDIFAKNKHFANRLSNNKRLKLHLFFDQASAEMFADGGEIAMTDIFFPTEDFTQFKIISQNGKATLRQAKAWNLKSIWR